MTIKDTMPHMLTVTEVAEQLAVSRSTVLRLLKGGILPSVHLTHNARNRLVRVRRVDLERYLHRCHTGGGGEPA